MNSTDTLVVIGAGQAGAEVALASRQLGWSGPIEMIGDERHLPYHRPPLSKAFLSGSATSESLTMRPQAAYDKAGVKLRLGLDAVTIDRIKKSVQLSDGSILRYEKLALCTGGRPRAFTVPGLPIGHKSPNVHVLRTQADADAIRSGLIESTRLVIIGGGYVGLEVAASARKLGARVTVLEAQTRVLARVAGPVLSAFYESVHRQAGVDLRTGVTVDRIECTDDGRVSAVICAGGERVVLDQLVVGVGMVPNVELADVAGLAVDRGILVDEFSVTSDPDIVAAGDCTSHDHALYGRRIRLESVPNALEQARAAASTVCGKPKANHSVPWFWSDQYDLKLQMVGLSEAFDQCVLRGLPDSRQFIAFYLKDGVVIAADAVNRPADFMVAKRLVSSAVVVDVDLLADEAAPLKSLLPPVTPLHVDGFAGKS